MRRVWLTVKHWVRGLLSHRVQKLHTGLPKLSAVGHEEERAQRLDLGPDPSLGVPM